MSETPEGEPAGSHQSEGRSHRAAVARDALLSRPKTKPGAILILSAVAFLLVGMRDDGLEGVLVLVGVLLLHELGHLAAMRLLGFSDLSMFFLPFFGAAVTGRKPGASSAAHALVSLAGPLPGLLVAVPLLAWTSRGVIDAETMPLVNQVVLMLVFINLLNLIPVPPLDGGRFFEVLVFSRWPWLDASFRVAAIVALGWVALNGMPVLGIVAVFMLLGTRSHVSVAFEAARLRRQRVLPADVEQLSEPDLEALYDAADRATPGNTGAYPREKLFAALLPRVFDRAARRPASVLQSIGLILLWAIGVVLALGELLYLVVDPSRW